MVITKQTVADKIAAYLHHDIALAELVDWAESVLMDGELAEPDVEVLSAVVARLGVADVRAFVEQLFADSICTYEERLKYLGRPRSWPYPALNDEVYGKKAPNRIKCGYNPFLYARRVKDLRVEMDLDGFERLLWEEIPV